MPVENVTPVAVGVVVQLTSGASSGDTTVIVRAGAVRLIAKAANTAPVAGDFDTAGRTLRTGDGWSGVPLTKPFSGVAGAAYLWALGIEGGPALIEVSIA